MTENNQDTEANIFALYLLMPSAYFNKDMKNEVSLVDEKIITRLVKKYQVTEGMLLARIKLYYLDNKKNK